MPNSTESAPPDLRWFSDHAESLDICNQHAAEVLPQLAEQGLLGIGVPESLGGFGGYPADVVEAIARVAQLSVTAAFVFWGHRSFIEYLSLSPNDILRSQLLPPLLQGQLAGATGLSNAIKFLSGIEQLQIQAETQTADAWTLDGVLPWVTNLRLEGFAVAAVVARSAGKPPMVVALRCDHAGLERTADLDLLALRGSNTAAIHLRNVEVQRDDLLHDNAQTFIARIRPSFLGFQCGLSLGLAAAALQAAQQQASRVFGNLLTVRIQTLTEALEIRRTELLQGLNSGYFVNEPHQLFQLRIALAELVQGALHLELEASGGRAYLCHHNADFSRRWRESAFIPLVTPSLVQLRGELQKHRVNS